MSRYAPGWERPSRSVRRPPLRLVLALALIPFLGGLFAAPAAPVVRGDQLSDAVSNRNQMSQQVAAQKAQIAQLNAMQAGLKADIAATTTALKSVNASYAAVKKQIDAMAAKIGRVQATYDSLVEQLAMISAQIPRIQAQEDQKAAQLVERKALLADRIRAAYSTDQTSLLETFLSGDSFTDVLTQVGYYMDVGVQDKALAEQIAQDQEALATIHQSLLVVKQQKQDLAETTAAQKKELDAQLADLKTARAQLKILQQQTAKALASQKSAYAKLSRNKAQAAKALAQAAAAQRRLQQQIDQLIAARKKYGNIPSQYNGTLAWPADGVISQEFGCTGVIWEPPLGSCPHFHQGIDIAAPMYTAVKAAGEGVVVFAGANPYDPPGKQAWIVIIAHSDALQTWYAHLDNAKHPIPVYAGQAVKQGQVIGYVGMTGNTTGPHLHWGVELDGQFLNPRLFV
jgi:murein DD-endopeptidase MepM/ murein hydrolase activator NlpD